MKRRNILQILCMLAIIGIIAVFSGAFAHVPTAHAATQSSGSWSTYLYDSGHSGFNKNETIITPTSVKTLKQKWIKTAGGLISVQPVEADGMVFGEHGVMVWSGQPVWPVNKCGQRALACLRHPIVDQVRSVLQAQRR